MNGQQDGRNFQSKWTEVKQPKKPQSSVQTLLMESGMSKTRRIKIYSNCMSWGLDEFNGIGNVLMTEPNQQNI